MRIRGMHDPRVHDGHEKRSEPLAGRRSPHRVNVWLGHTAATVRWTDRIRIAEFGCHAIIERSIIVHGPEARDRAAAQLSLEGFHFRRDMREPAPKLLFREFVQTPDAQVGWQGVDAATIRACSVK